MGFRGERRRSSTRFWAKKIFHRMLLLVAAGCCDRSKSTRLKEGARALSKFLDTQQNLSIPRSRRAILLDERVAQVRSYLNDPLGSDFRSTLSNTELRRLVKYASRFFLFDGVLWRRRQDGRHQKVLDPTTRLAVLREVHDGLGHKGAWIVGKRLTERFWWPQMHEDIAWWDETCDECQRRRNIHFYLPPTVAFPMGLFQKCYIDTMIMTASEGCKYLVHARCSLVSYPEAKGLRTESASTIGKFLLEHILSRWGSLLEIVTDNGPAFVAAAKWLSRNMASRTSRSRRTTRGRMVLSNDGTTTCGRPWSKLAEATLRNG